MISGASLDEWRAGLRAEDDCPWPGPRPLGPSDAQSLLCGRDVDCTRFRQAVDSHRLVFLGGKTGVGKTSLLLRGLVPELETSGYVVASCRNWSGTDTQSNPAQFLTDRVRPELERAGVPDLPHDVSMFAEVNQRLGQKVVLVLDQFEELIRDAPQFKDGLFRALAHLNRNTELRIVISLRSEYLHELRPLERAVTPFSLTHYDLDEVRDEFAAKIVAAGNSVVAGSIDVGDIDVGGNAEPGGFAAELAQLWHTARRAATLDGVEVGLLHLQGMLFALHVRAAGQMVTRATLDTFVAELVSARPHGHAVGELPADELFVAALQESVDLKLDRCKKVAYGLGLDPYFVEGTALLVGRMVRHLASAGYKLVRDAYELAEMTLGAELELLYRGLWASHNPDGQPDGPINERQPLALFDVLVSAVLVETDSDTPDRSFVDLLARREEVAAAADRRVPELSPGWEARLFRGPSAFDADPAETTSGPMLGQPPAAVVIEELRRFVFALDWLQQTDLIRLTTPRSESVMVALIHDGFGRALELWTQSGALSRCGAIYGITAPLGAEFYWKTDDGSLLPEFDGTTGPERSAQMLANLRWRGAWISADFRAVMFVNCDLRGSQFASCRLEGVTFVNCLLDGVLFSDCTIVGHPGGAGSGQKLSSADAFEVDEAGDTASLIGRYQNVELHNPTLLADSPQNPAIPAIADPSRRQLSAHTGGVAVYGGRTSSLLVRRCRFEDGCFSLRETAGSGVDIVENQHGGRFEVLDSRLRHVTFSSSPTDSARSEPVDIYVERSWLVQFWIGHDVEGLFNAVDSVLIQGWNGSESAKATLRAASNGASCRYLGLIGFELDGDHAGMVEGELLAPLASVDRRGEIRRQGVGMDYRRNAAEREVDLDGLNAESLDVS